MAHVPKVNHRSRGRWYGMVMIVSTCLLTGCIHVLRTIHVDDVAVTDEPTRVRLPLRAHMVDGSVVVYDSGAVVSRTVIEGAGRRHDPLRNETRRVTTIPMDSVLGLESYNAGTQATASTVLVSVGETALVVFVCWMGLLAYAYSGGT